MKPYELWKRTICLLLYMFLVIGCSVKPQINSHSDQPACTIKRSQLGIHFTKNMNSAEVLRLNPESPAEKIGIKAGDIILCVNDMPVKNEYEYRTLMRSAEQVSVTLLIQRNSERLTKIVVPVTVGIPRIIYAIEDILSRDKGKVYLSIVTNNVTNSTGLDPLRKDEWKKGISFQLRNDSEVVLLDAFQRHPAFSIIERKDIEDFIQELLIQRSGFATEQINSGKMIGATHVLYLDMHRGTAEDYSAVDLVSRRLIEIETGKTISSEICQSIAPK